MIVTLTVRDLRELFREEFTVAFKKGLAPMRERWVNIAAAADHARVSKKLIRNWIMMGLPAATFGRDYRLRLSDVDKWLEQHRARHNT